MVGVRMSLDQLQKRIQLLSGIIYQLEHPEMGAHLHSWGHQSLSVRYTHTAGTVPYTATVWTPSTIAVPAGGMLRATMLVDNYMSGYGMNYLRLWNNNPPAWVGTDDDVTAKYPVVGQAHRRFPTLQMDWPYEAATTVQLELKITEIITGVTYAVYETWTRLFWEIWL